MNNTRYNNRLLAWEYDQRNSKLQENEMDWYLKYAKKYKGNIIEFACGSGRITIPFALNGYKLDAVDLSEEMLNRLKDKSKKVNAENNINLYKADMMNFTNNKKYNLAFIGYNSITYLEEKRKYKKFIKSVYNILYDKGTFLLMVSLPNLKKYTNSKKIEVNWLDKPIINKKENISVGSKFISYLDKSGNRIVKERIYNINKNNEITKINYISYIPVLSVKDYKKILEEAGFEVNAYKGYQEKNYNGENDCDVCFVCMKD